MRIGLIDVDGHNFPNLPLMKISAYHKAKGDSVEWYEPLFHSMGEPLDIVYMSRVFGDEYSSDYPYCVNAKQVIKGGTGYHIKVVDGAEVFDKENHKNLPEKIEHMYPDYSLYPEYTKDTAYGFLTRGCCNDCSFCIVSKKEGRCSRKVADLSEWWNGQKKIKLLDPNILACKDHMDLLQQLVDSKAKVDFTQGLDARFVNEENLKLLKQINIEMLHFAFDFMKFEKQIIKGLALAKEILQISDRDCIVYMLTNYDTTIEEDLYRISKIREVGFAPDVRIYRKESLPHPHILRDLQRWCNNRFLYRSCDFMDYVPRKDGKTIRQLYLRGKEMDIKEFAEMLNGREYGYKQFTEEEIQIAKDNGFVIVYGASDDLMEFDGAIYDEAGCFDGGEVYFDKNGVAEEEEEKPNMIEALWCVEDDICWTYKTDIPHETFMIYEDGEKYCRGIIFDIKDIKE